MNTTNDLIREIGILDTVLGNTKLCSIRRAKYMKKVNSLRKMLRIAIKAIRRNKK